MVTTMLIQLLSRLVKARNAQKFKRLAESHNSQITRDKVLGQQ